MNAHAAWMIVASFLFACMGVCVKLGAATLPTSTMVFFRGLVALLLVAAWIVVRGHTVVTRNWRAHLARGVSGYSALALYFYAIGALPLATAVTLSYTSPLFLALLLLAVERQRMRPVVVVALGVGLTGVALLLRPVFEASYWQAGLLGLLGGALAAVAFYNVRRLGRLGEPAWRTVFYFSLVTTLFAVPGAVSGPALSAIGLREMALLFGVGAFGASAQLALTRAYEHGDALVVASLSYTTVVFAALFGAMLWHEVLPAVAWLGMALIIASGIAVTRPPGGSRRRNRTVARG